jgi:hypothetical protein
MGRVKEIFMEIQEMYDGEVPVNFDYDSYLNKRAAEIASVRDDKINKILNVDELVSIDDHCSVKEV